MQAVLLEIPRTPQEWKIFSFHHQLSHRAIIDAIFADRQLALENFVLDPMPDVSETGDLLEIGSWLQLHQQAHTAFSAVLGTLSQDLSIVDLSDEKQRQAWVYLNFQAHFAAENVLRI